MNRSENTDALHAALVKAQKAIKPVALDAVNPFLKNRYASLGAVIAASRDALHENGLTLSQWPCGGEGEVGVETVLTHESGQWISERLTLPLGEERGKSLAQVAGSIVTYLRRYAWAAVLGMYADEDDDGSIPQPKAQAPSRTSRSSGSGGTQRSGTISEKQAKFLHILIKETATDVPVTEAAIKEKFGVEHFAEIPYAKGKKLIDDLVSKRDAMGGPPPDEQPSIQEPDDDIDPSSIPF